MGRAALSVVDRRHTMKRAMDDDTERDIASLVGGIGQRLQRDMPVSERVPFKMALLIEHLRRSESQDDKGAAQ
jgi:hypothetical protein